MQAQSWINVWQMGPHTLSQTVEVEPLVLPSLFVRFCFTQSAVPNAFDLFIRDALATNLASCMFFLVGGRTTMEYV
jgi:hypothetical protein